MKIMILYYSATNNVLHVAQEVALGIASFNCDAIVDLVPVAELSGKVERMTEYDAIVFGAPTYFGSLPGVFKTVLEQTDMIWLAKKLKDKVAAGFTHSMSYSGDKLSTLQQMCIFAMQHGMIWCGLDIFGEEAMATPDLNRLGGWLGLMTQSKEDKLSDGDLKTAHAFGHRIASVTAKLLKSV